MDPSQTVAAFKQELNAGLLLSFPCLIKLGLNPNVLSVGYSGTVLLIKREVLALNVTQ